MSDNIKVVVKVRPLISRELDDKLSYQWRIHNNTLYQLDQNGRDCGPAYTFDKVYDRDTKTCDVYNDVAKPIVEAAVTGFNGTIFAYGQTSSGKTYTMTGTDLAPGLIPLAVLNLFDIIKKVPGREFLVRVSYVEIYNETLIDLLDMKKQVKIQDTVHGVKVDATYKVTTSPEEVLELMREGKANRQTGSTNMNEESSRSHLIFQITIESREHVEGEEEVGSVNVSLLNLVDLAGSERSGQTGATGIRFKEGTHINKSLSTLALVIKQLSEGVLTANKHVNYRDSKLTRILQNSLGGNAKTSIICAVTPAAIEETISTLQFANRAKAIKNTPAVNAVATDASMIQLLTKQLSEFKTQLEGKRTVEQDNFKLQKQITHLQKLILNGFVGRTGTELASGARRKLQPPRRVTISTLHPIQEDPLPAMPKFCTPSLKYNPLALSSSVSDFVPLQGACSLHSVTEEPRLITPPPDRKVNFSDEIIELDSDDDTSDAHICSPYHKCRDSTKTPPCVLRKTAKQAEKNFKEIVELTEREKIYTPNVVELMEKLESKTNKISELEDELTKLDNLSKDRDKDMDLLKINIRKAEEEINKITVAKEELEKACKDYDTKLTDWEVSYETLKKKSKSRENDLLSLLHEHEMKNKREVISKISQAVSKEMNFMDMSRDISLVDSDCDNSIINVKPTPSNVLSQLTQDSQTILNLKANLNAQMIRIDSLENINLELQSTIEKYKENISLVENENTLHKSTIVSLNNIIENHKSSIETLSADVESYKNFIQELQLKITLKDNNASKIEMSEDDVEKNIANEELFMGNNENFKNVLHSLKTALNSRDEEIKQLKSTIKANAPNLDFSMEIKDKKKDILALKDEIYKLKNLENENKSIIDSFVQEKTELLNIQLQLKNQLNAIQNDKELLVKANNEQKQKLIELKEYNNKLTSDYAQKEKEIDSENENLKIEINNLHKIISNMEECVKEKDNIIKTLYKEDMETQENIDNAKCALAKLQNVMSLFTDNMSQVPIIVSDLVTAFNKLNCYLSSLEALAVETISERNNLRHQLDKQGEEINNIQAKVEDTSNGLDTFFKEFQNMLNLNNEYVKPVENDAIENLKRKIMDLIIIFKTSENKLNQSIQDKGKEVKDIKSEHEKALAGYQTEIDDLIKKRDTILENIFEKATHITSELNIENSISCNISNDADNLYEQIALTLDKISNHVNILIFDKKAKCNDMDVILAEAKSEIKQLTEENLELIQNTAELKKSNETLSSELKTIHEDTKNITADLNQSKLLLNELEQELVNKSKEIELIEDKAKEWKYKFNDLEISMRQEIDTLQAENGELNKSRSCLVMRKDYNSKAPLKNENDYTEVSSPPSLLTICCNKITTVIENKKSEITNASSENQISDSLYENNCRCEDLTLDIATLKAKNSELKTRIVELENDNEHLHREQEKVDEEVRLLLECSYELQKKLVNHRTNLSTLTATTYAENRSLSSQLKFFQHHHSRFHTVCQRDISEFKKQLHDLLAILQSENLFRPNDSFKRYSLPNALENASLHFKNESTMDGDLLMLDTNVTLTTCDNTVLASDQTCFDTTQVCLYSEVACQTDIETNSNVSHSQIEVESLQIMKISETLESLKMENNKLRYLVDDYSRNKKSQVVDSQTSPLKISAFKKLGNDNSKDESITRIVDETTTTCDFDIDVYNNKLLELECEKTDIEQEYYNLTLEVPNTEALVHKLTTLERECSRKQIEVEALTNSLNKKNKEIIGLQEENDTLSNQLMEYISEVDDLKTEHDTLRKTNNMLSGKFAQLEQEIRYLKTNNEEAIVCSNCVLKDEVIGSLENRQQLLAQSHAKLDRSYSDSDSSSRYNKICTLQNELHAGKEDCIKIKEDVTTIKNHLERSNLAISHDMELYESINDPITCSFHKDFGNTNYQEKCPNVTEKIECVNYFREKTGAYEEISQIDIKILDLMKMLYEKLTVKHANELENIVNKLRDFEESKIDLENKVLKLKNEQELLTKDLSEKDEYLQRMANVMSQIRNNVNAIKEDVNDDLELNFTEIFLKAVDQEFDLGSTPVFESICEKYNNVISKINKEKQQLAEEVKDMTSNINTINKNLITLESQLHTNKEEINLLGRQKEKLREISSAVTMDIVNKEKNLRLCLLDGCKKLFEDKVIHQEIDSSLSTLDIISTLFKSVDLQFSLIQEQIKDKETLSDKIQQLQNIEEDYKTLAVSLSEKEQQNSYQLTLYEDLNKTYQNKVLENNANLNTINELMEVISAHEQNIVRKDAIIDSLKNKITTLTGKIHEEHSTKVIEQVRSTMKLQKEIDDLKSINRIILEEKESCENELSNACAQLAKHKIDIEKLNSDIQILRNSVKENTSLVETLQRDKQTLLEQTKTVQAELEKKRNECTTLMGNIKIHERTAQVQSGMIIRLEKQKEKDDKVCVEKENLIQELNRKWKSLETLNEKLNADLKACKEELEESTKLKQLLEYRISQLESGSEVKAKKDVSTDITESTRRRRQSIHDSKRIFSDSVQDPKKLEAAFNSRNKPEDLFMDVDDDSSARSTPLGRLSRGRDSLASKHDHSDNAEEHSRPSSVVASRRRRQSVHDLHRSVRSHENSRESSRNNSYDGDMTQLRKQLSSCHQELEDLKEKYKELDEECEICAQYLQERDEQCLRLKKEKAALENIVGDLKEKLKGSNPNMGQGNTKSSSADASVNTDEDWTNLHSVVVDRMSYNAEVEKNKKLVKTIEEVRFKNHDLKTTMAKMQKALEKNNGKDNKELETTKAELVSVKQELEELKERYKELDEECETCAEYLRERDEQCSKLKEAKAHLEAKLQEYLDTSIKPQSVRKRRQTLHDQNRPSTTTLTDATTQITDDFPNFQGDSSRHTDDSYTKEIKRLKSIIEKMNQQKSVLESQLLAASSTPLYVATGSAIVQNQQLTNVMKENQKLKKINAKLITICQKRRKSQLDTNRENEDPSEQMNT